MGCCKNDTTQDHQSFNEWLSNMAAEGYRRDEIVVHENWSRDAAVVTIGIGDLAAVGSSKRAPEDTHDPGTGRPLAMARALRKLADQYEALAGEKA